MLKDAISLIFGKDERQALLMFGVDKLVEFTDRDAHDVPIEKDDGVECLVLGCWGNIAFHRQIGDATATTTCGHAELGDFQLASVTSRRTKSCGSQVGQPLRLSCNGTVSQSSPNIHIPPR